MAAPERVNCFKCRHFYVTWDLRFPRGCMILGFKGKEIPSQVVLKASGMACLHFESKNISLPKERSKNS